MRPLSGNDPGAPRSRKSSVAGPSAPASNVPTTFFLRSEEELESSLAKSKTKTQDSTYGVKSLEDTLGEAFGQPWEQEPAKSPASEARRRLDGKASPKQQQQQQQQKSAILQHISTFDQAKSSSKQTSRRPSRHNLSYPETPTRLESPSHHSTIPNTPRSASLRSFRLSDEELALDEVASQAVTSSGEEEDEDAGRARTSPEMPELVMPSIQMPTRRPFTKRGKNLGRLKVLVAGETGSGKSSFIRSLVQLCEDIVHVDPLAQSTHNIRVPSPSDSKSGGKKGEDTRTVDVQEINASTRAYPAWWSDMEESRVLRRRKSQGDTVLERNLCLIDTPGYRESTSTEDVNRVIEYMESLLYQNTALATMTENELLGILSGDGGVHVDVVIYLFTQKGDISRDIDFFLRLSDLSNVIPVINKGDSLDASQLHSLKESILTSLEKSSARPFLFGKTLKEQMEALGNHQGADQPGTSGLEILHGETAKDCVHPFAVSSSPVSDSEVMDASLLMSSDYIQPLLPSEFPPLVSLLFDPENVSWLRHAAARKFIHWRRRTAISADSMLLHKATNARADTASHTRSPLHRRFSNSVRGTASVASSLISSPSQVLVPQPTSPFYSQPVSPNHSATAVDSRPSDFMLARLKDHTQREERLAQIRLAKWAVDLQRSLQNERGRFERLERDKRARWLLERVGEEVRSGAIVPASQGAESPSTWAMVWQGSNPKSGDPSGRWGYAGGDKIDSGDPLGVCEWGDGAKSKGIVVLQVLGGAGVLGAVMVAVVKAWGGAEGSGAWSWVIGGE